MGKPSKCGPSDGKSVSRRWVALVAVLDVAHRGTEDSVPCA